MRRVLLLFLSLFLGLSACKKHDSRFDAVLSQSKDFAIWIRDGQIIDGTGKLAYTADILLRADTIAFIGTVPLDRISANDTVDAKGKVISPGFIDTHAHGDPFQTPDFHNFLAMGVTTISLGQDGFGIEKEDIRLWMDSVERKGTGPNIIVYTGHSSLRRLSGVGFHPEPTAEEIARMTDLLEAQLDAGSFGLTTGLEYTPGLYASAPELTALAKVTGQKGRILMSHLRNEDDDQLKSSIDELLTLGQHCKVHVSHIKSVYGKGPERAREVLGWLNSAREAGVSITADIYPYSASYTGIGIVFPIWAKAPHDYAKVKQNRRAELATYLRKRVNRRNGPEATLLGSGPFAGKSLAQVAQDLEKPFEEVLIDDIGPTGASGAYFVMNEPLQEELVQDPNIMICSDGSPTGFHPRGHGTFAKVIREYVNEKRLFSLEEAIRKMTGLSAETIGLKDRGLLQTGKVADIVIFDPEEVTDLATYTQPHRLAMGFEFVIVRGNIALRKGIFADQRFGHVIRFQW